MNTHTLFVVLYYISTFVMLGCFIILCNQSPSRMQKHALIVAVALLVCNIGYLFKVEATTIEGLIIGQKLLYTFVTYGMFYMIRFTLDYCNYKVHRVVDIIFQSLNAIIAIVVLTLDHHQLFYKSYWIVNQGGYPVLEKEYGIFHTIAIALFIFYMAASLIIAIIYSINNAKKKSSYVWKLLLAVSIPCLSYILQKIFDPQYDFQPIAFAIFSVLVIYLIYNYKLYDVNGIIVEFSSKSLDEAVVVLDDKNNFKGCNDFARELFNELNDINLDENINNASNSIKQILDGEVNDIEFDDKIYSATITPLRNAINKEIGKVIRLKDVTIERNYTKLLQHQVDTLSNFSYQDDMTGCFNRRCFEEALNAIREKGNVDDVTLWSMDANGLKKANDTIGHSAGDELIKGAADVFHEVFNDYGEVFRTGGDEFFVIIDNNIISNEKLAQKLKEAVENWHGKQVDKLSVSAGYIEGNKNKDKTIDELVVLADQEMYKKKREYYQSSNNDRRRR